MISFGLQKGFATETTLCLINFQFKSTSILHISFKIKTFKESITILCYNERCLKRHKYDEINSNCPKITLKREVDLKKMKNYSLC